MESEKGEYDRQQRRDEASKPCGKNDGAKHQRCDGLGLQLTCYEVRSNYCNGNRQNGHCVVRDRMLGAAGEEARGRIPEMGGLDTHHLQCVLRLWTAIRASWRRISNSFRLPNGTRIAASPTRPRSCYGLTLSVPDQSDHPISARSLPSVSPLSRIRMR